MCNITFVILPDDWRHQRSPLQCWIHLCRILDDMIGLRKSKKTGARKEIPRYVKIHRRQFNSSMVRAMHDNLNWIVGFYFLPVWDLYSPM